MNKFEAALERIKKNVEIQDNWTKEDIEHYKTVVEALEKRIPKKPVIDKEYSMGRFTVAFCPSCRDLLGLLSFAKNTAYCNKCGQALDWGDNEEGGAEE